uniref:General transcription factor 3C polypeptide 6 n=1 Tax=Hucho hucho TaxID=62062 RepID=A0A4W5MCV9_9TELE
MEDEWEEEEQLVVVELSGIINSDFLTKCQGTCKILDIDSEQPMMQVGRYVFAGEYDDALGTCVLFEEGQSSGADPEASPELSYKCHTVKRLMMQRTFLAEKKEGDNSSGYTHTHTHTHTHSEPSHTNKHTHCCAMLSILDQYCGPLELSW